MEGEVHLYIYLPIYSKNWLVRYPTTTIYSILRSTPLDQSVFGVILRYSDF